MASRVMFAADREAGWRPWGFAVPIIGVVLVALSTGGVSLVLERLHLLGADGPIGLTGFVAFLVLPFAALGAILWAWVRLVERRTPAAIGLTRAAPTRTFLRGHLVGVAMVVVIAAVMWAIGAVEAGGRGAALRSAPALGSIALLLPCFALQSSVEEIVFRGWMLASIAAKYGAVVAIVLTSLMFTLLHLDDGVSRLFLANIFLFSVFTCCWARSSGNVWGVMGWHAGWNWLWATGFATRVTGLDAHLPALLVTLTPRGPEHLTGGSQGPEASVVTGVVLLAGVVALIARGSTRPARTP